MPLDMLNILCPAKINLVLSVGPPRVEDGLHEICSWMVAVGACDQVVIARSTDGLSSFDIRWDVNSPLPQTVDWPLSSDLAFRAHRLMQEHVGYALPVKVKVHKTLPAGAGLGGGSSDAAGMLSGLNQLFSLGLKDEELIQLGLRLGSDVGFMVWTMLGKGPAIVSGTGDRIEPAPDGKRMICLVMILPPVQCATAAVYQAFDGITHEPSLDEQRVRSLAGVWPVVKDVPFNDLTEAAFTVQPTLREIRDRVQEAAGMPVHLSGSGAAMFIVVPSSDEGMVLSQTITDRTGLAAIWALSYPSMPG